MKILHIEDDDLFLKYVQRQLLGVCGEELELSKARDLAEADPLLDAGSFDMVLLDLTLPDSRGLATLEHVRASAGDTPIVVFTGWDDEKTGIEAIQRGAEDYVVKRGVETEALVRSVRYAYERKRIDDRRAERDQSIQQRVVDALSADEPDGDSGAATDEIHEAYAQLATDYRALMESYTTAVSKDEDRPLDEIKRLARHLAALGAGARRVVRIHVAVLEEVERNTPSSRRARLIHDSRFLLLELLGHLLDRYLNAQLTNEDADRI